MIRTRGAMPMMVSIILLTGCAGPESPPSPPDVGRTAPIASATDTTVEITKSWTALVPGGAVPADTTLTIIDRTQSSSAEAIGHGAADLTLASGQPRTPITLTLQLPQPLPRSSTMLLLDDTGANADPEHDPSAATVRTATLNDDRTVATVQVDHLSDKQWWEVPIDNVAHFITSVAGQRTNPPTCATQPRPSWLENAIFTEGQNAPLLVCTGTDPKDPDTAVVKIKNNRGGAMIVTAPVTPKWAAQSLATGDGSISSAITDLLTLTTEPLGVPADERPRTWVLPPGGGVDIGFTKASLEQFRGIAPITTKFTTASAAYGVIWQLLSAAVGDPALLTALELGFMGSCVHDAGRDVLDARTAQELAAGVAELATCVVELGPDIIKDVQKRVSPDVWKRISGPALNRALNVAKTKVLPLVTAAQAVVAITDLVSTLALDAAAFTVTLVTEITARNAPKPAGITDSDIANITIPAGTCGTSAQGWNQTAPIVLKDGKGEARTPTGTFGGASIVQSTLHGWADIDNDGLSDAVVDVHCTGSTLAQCCAGRSSHLSYIAVLNFSKGRTPTLIGAPIKPGTSPLTGKTYGAERFITDTRIDRLSIVTEEQLIYADSTSTSELGFPATATIEVTHNYVAGRWESAERVLR
ncbi:hypothetical protein ACWDOP_16570 [Nocardia sp. NPDC003693]